VEYANSSTASYSPHSYITKLRIRAHLALQQTAKQTHTLAISNPARSSCVRLHVCLRVSHAVYMMAVGHRAKYGCLAEMEGKKDGTYLSRIFCQAGSAAASFSYTRENICTGTHGRWHSQAKQPKSQPSWRRIQEGSTTPPQRLFPIDAAA